MEKNLPELKGENPKEQTSAQASTYVGIWYRFLARFIDGMIVGVIGSPFLITLFVVIFRASFEASKNSTAFNSDIAYTSTQSLIIGACSLAYLLISACYMIFTTSSKLQGTLGKRILGFKVVDLEGKRVSLGRSAKRYFAMEGIGIPYSILGNSTNVATKGISAAFGVMYSIYLIVDASIGGGDAKKQTIHDKIAKTYVVYR